MKIEFGNEFKDIFDSIATRYEATKALKNKAIDLCESGRASEVEAKSMDEVDAPHDSD